ncbi:MAG TPA: ribokinase [Candidatus Acidoferrales bacterium]|nr:ribokinase [Candidatus Acidoferrales bacterium]
MNGTPRIVVVGSANIDLVTYTDEFPRPGETIFGREFSLGFGGKGANQAVAARLCGAETAMVARVGEDLFGPATIENFASRGIDVSHVKVTPGVSSGVAPIFVESSGQNRIWVVKGANDKLMPEDVEAAAGLIERADFIVLQLEIPLQTVFHTLRFARSRGIRTILNPAPGQPLDLEAAGFAEYVTPNETEAEALAGMPVGNLAEARACAQSLLARGLRRVIITLGANGCLLAEPGRMQHVPPFAVTPVDTTGAGDAFTGSLACFLAEGYEEAEALSRANLYAALSTLAPGTQKSFVKRERFEQEWTARRAGSAGTSR